MKNSNMAKQNIFNKINLALNKIRPMLQEDGGDVELVDFEEATGVLQVRLLGHCAGCMMANMTLKNGVERMIREAVPEVKEVAARK